MEKIKYFASQPYTTPEGFPVIDGLNLNSLDSKTVIEKRLWELKIAVDGFENSAIALRADFDIAYKQKLESVRKT